MLKRLAEKWERLTMQRIRQSRRLRTHSKEVFTEINGATPGGLNNHSPQIDVNEPNSKIRFKLLDQATASDGSINGAATTSGSEDKPRQNGTSSPTAEENHTNVSPIMTRAKNNRSSLRRSYSTSTESKTLKYNKAASTMKAVTTPAKNTQNCRKENSAVSSTGVASKMKTRTRRSRRNASPSPPRSPTPPPPPSPPKPVSNGHAVVEVKEEDTNKSEDEQATTSMDTHTDTPTPVDVVVENNDDDEEGKAEPPMVRTTASEQMIRSISETLKANLLHLQMDLQNNNNMQETVNSTSEQNERASTSAELKRSNADESCPLSPKKSFRGVLSDTDQASDSEGSVRLRQRKHSKSYQVGKLKCPTPGCDSKGHLYGRYERHYSVKTCPMHQNLTPERCRENKEAIIRIKQEQAAATMDCVEDLEKTIQLSVMEDKNRQAAVDKLTASSSKGGISSRKSKYHKAQEYKQLIQKGISPEDISTYDQSKDAAAQKYREEMKKACANAKKGPGARKPVKKVEFGRYVLDCWSPSKYVEEYCKSWKLYICEFCLKYMNSKSLLVRHMNKCLCQCPPGNEIYRKDNISIFEVDGAICKMYCQNLCLLAMLFIESKTVYLETEPFKFYVMTDRKPTGDHIIGYFSKEKVSFLSYNLSCILVLPHYLEGGYGRMLIDVSYHLSRIEKAGKELYGTPERPLSQPGLKAYRGYWNFTVMQILSNDLKDGRRRQLTIRELCDTTGIAPQEMYDTLKRLDMAKVEEDGRFLLVVKEHLIRAWEEKQRKFNEKFAKRKIDPCCFEWSIRTCPALPVHAAAAAADSSTASEDVPSTSSSST